LALASRDAISLSSAFASFHAAAFARTFS
jgi:hypothetical protein